MQERPSSHASSLTPSSSTASSTTSSFPSISDPPTSSSSPSSSSAPFHMIWRSFPPSNASGSSTSCSSHHLLSPSRLLQGTRNFQISAIFLVLILLNAFPTPLSLACPPSSPPRRSFSPNVHQGPKTLHPAYFKRAARRRFSAGAGEATSLPPTLAAFHGRGGGRGGGEGGSGGGRALLHHRGGRKGDDEAGSDSSGRDGTAPTPRAL
ncbi:hypothetical protein NGA_0500200 [Nannochloropsis gaditana CCMP526]|uniref:uncharacterized protein n=1 Tax=Nannochloropsis gaditana (strain CCMP526) TaxID=1093141 RepID=UPI00029F7E89|nr:hypothetical protein NGA_0500200 [Nannochloropsis gaditana CCMP526]EKU22758.1 hypothetical protein NGA_0500200 [Nannochloropsis gaditana CCMP526]|eukprot:XP_005853603.1 hypothetical protein NGA_0500200 [Nannochloropsis gaditana CCMP526]